MNLSYLAQVLAFVAQLKFIEGYRTYLTAAGLVGFGVFECSQGRFDTGLQSILTGLGLFFGREAVRNLGGPKEPPAPLPFVS